MTVTDEAYSGCAREYTELFGSMSAVHPSDRQIIDSWAATVRGRVLDAGCGPGHWTHHLTGLGLDARGIDLAPPFIEHAKRTYPGITFDVGNLEAIDETNGSLAGLLAWFSTIHYEPTAIARPIAEFARVLRPGGRLVLGFFSGDSLAPFEHAVARAYRWPAHDLRELLRSHGFEVLETHIRDVLRQRPVGAMVCERAGSL